MLKISKKKNERHLEINTISDKVIKIYDNFTCNLRKTIS